MVACIFAIFPGASDPVGARRIPPHLLLLPRKLLQSTMGRSSSMRRRRASRRLSRRAIVSADHSECSSIFSLSRCPFLVFAFLCCLYCSFVHGCSLCYLLRYWSWCLLH